MPPFDWMEPKRNPAHARTLAAKRQAMYETELGDRAALLQRLGLSRQAARARLGARLAWDFEGRPTPVGDQQLDAILDRVFGNGASAGALAGMPSRAPCLPFSAFSVAFNLAQFASTSSAVTVLLATTSPKTWGWRRTSLVTMPRATSSMPKAPSAERSSD